MDTQILTQSRLKELTVYDPETGEFIVRVKRKKLPVGAKLGSPDQRGYLRCMIDTKMYKLHRLAWLYMYGKFPDGQIDHINHNTADNRIANLRDVTCAQNHQNRARKTNSASGHLGVTWHKRDKRWQAYIEIGGVNKHLGHFIELTDAVAARKQAELQYHPHRPT